MSIRSESAFTAAPAVGNLNLFPVAKLLAETSAVSDLVEVSSLEMSLSVPVVPSTVFHLRVEFENGKDVYVSFDGNVRDSHDDHRTYKEAQLSNFHLNGLPADPAKVDALFENAVDQL